MALSAKDYNNLIMAKKKCPYCGLIMKEYKPDNLICSRCGRRWDIIGGFPNGVPCEDVKGEDQ